VSKRVLRTIGWPESGNSGVALHAITLTLNSGEPKKRGAHRNEGSHGRWSQFALRGLFVDVLLLQLDKRHYRIGEKAKGPTEALQYLATVERASMRVQLPKATEAAVLGSDGHRYRELLPTRSDAKCTIVLSGLPKGSLPSTPRHRESWLRALDMEREGKARIKYEKPASYQTLRRAFYKYLRALAADAGGEVGHIAAELAALRAGLHKEQSGESYFDEALAKVQATLAAWKAHRDKSK
jgi:hypothetical protein